MAEDELKYEGGSLLADDVTLQFIDELLKLNLDFPILQQRFQARAYDILEKKRNKKEPVSNQQMSNIRALFDTLQESATIMYRDNIILKTKLEEKSNAYKSYEELASRISRKSQDLEDTPQEKVVQKDRREDEYTLLVTPIEKDQDLSDIKKDMRIALKDTEGGITPKDVITTREKTIVLKLKNRSELVKSTKVLKDLVSIKDRVKIVVPKRRRYRILILSVDPQIEEKEVQESLENHLVDLTTATSVSYVKEKIRDRAMDLGSELNVSQVLDSFKPEIEIIRCINTRQDKKNWLVDVDKESRDYLIENKRICIAFERYRVTEFVQISRCNNCQKYGHLAFKCSETQKCANCGGPHWHKECKITEPRCINCAEKDLEDEHRADSSQCPVYQEYRKALLSKRL